MTLMDWGNVVITKIDKQGDVVTAVSASLRLEGDVKKVRCCFMQLVVCVGGGRDV